MAAPKRIPTGYIMQANQTDSKFLFLQTSDTNTIITVCKTVKDHLPMMASPRDSPILMFLPRAYIMQWGDHKTNVHNHLRVLFEEQKFVDLTLFCSTHSVKVHSVVIASNSSYFEKVLLSQNGVNSVIVLKDMKFEVLRALIEFMYCGETTVLDEDVDALLYASKKFEVKGLSRMTRQGIMFSATEKTDNDTTEVNHRFIFPAESAQPGMIQAVLDLTQNQSENPVLENNKFDSLYFKKAVFHRRGRPHKKHGNFGFPEAAMSDTEYAILKEAEESRKALEKLQNYVLNPKGMTGGTTSSQVPTSGKRMQPFLYKTGKNQINSEENKSDDRSYSNLTHPMEDEIAAENLSNELNQQNQNEILESTDLSVDVPIFVDDGNGNYVTLDMEMANMMAGQEIKYNLVQGVFMTSDGKGRQHSNPASILILENQFQPESLPILTCDKDGLESDLHMEVDSSFRKSKLLQEDNEDITSSIDCGNVVVKGKPFIVKEIIKLKQPKTNGENMKVQGRRDEEEGPFSVQESLVKFGKEGVEGIMF